MTHRGSRTNLTQDDPSLYAALSPQIQVTRETPPAFLVHGTNDGLVPVKNSLLYYEACLKAGVPVEMHILDNGPHGFGMGTARHERCARGRCRMRFIIAPPRRSPLWRNTMKPLPMDELAIFAPLEDSPQAGILSSSQGVLRHRSCPGSAGIRGRSEPAYSCASTCSPKG